MTSIDGVTDRQPAHKMPPQALEISLSYFFCFSQAPLLKRCRRSWVFLFFFFESTRPACKFKATLPRYLSICNETRPRERRERGRFYQVCFYGKKAFSYRGAYGVPLLNQSVCLSYVGATFVVLADCESCTWLFCGLHNRYVGHIAVGVHSRWQVHRNLQNSKIVF